MLSLRKKMNVIIKFINTYKNEKQSKTTEQQCNKQSVIASDWIIPTEIDMKELKAAIVYGEKVLITKDGKINGTTCWPMKSDIHWL